MKIFLDFETRSAVDIKKVGAWKYAAHPSTTIICLSVGRTGQEPTLFKGYELVKPPPAGSIFGPATRFVAHSAHFEYAIYHYILHKRYGWPDLSDPKHWDCTMARALVCGLPASLEGVGAALRLPIQKDLEGRAALMKICKPVGADIFGAPIYNQNPELYKKVFDYCNRDIQTEMAVDRALPELSPEERKVFELDLIMNRRGVAIDVQACESAAAIAEQLTTNLNESLFALTGGKVTKASRVAEMKRFLESQGVKIPIKQGKDGEDKETLDKNAILGLLKDPKTPPLVKAVVAIRQQVGKSSTAKFTATLNAAGEDGRVRGAIQYYGAHTGRFAGRLIQPQNYPGGLVGEEQETAIELLCDFDLFALTYGDKAMQTLSDILRGTIIAGKGKKLVSADYSAIEARTLFWIANVTRALEGYARGESPYIRMASRIYKNPNITKKTHPLEYALGKAAVLGAGYQMGPVRFRAQCATAREPILIDEKTAETAINAYREEYPEVVSLWYAMSGAAINAVKNPGKLFGLCGNKVVWGMSSSRQFLACRLPSGRYLRYFRPTIQTANTPRGEREELHYWGSAGEGALEVEGQLGRYKTYGGALTENVVQAIARDVLVNGMLNCEARGYPLVLTVHDEPTAEVVMTVGTDEGKILENFIKEMCTLPAWAAGLPVAAEGWIGERYRK